MNRNERLTLIAAILGSGIVFLDSTVINIALPSIAGSLHTDYSGLQWIVDGYLLTLSAMILFGGSLGDIYGHKRIFKLGLAGFAVASLVCAVSPNIATLTLARLLQGGFGALLVPASLAVINTTFPNDKRAQAIGRWTAFAGIFTALGPLAGGLLLALSWRWLFFINIPLIVACYLLIRAGSPDRPRVGVRAKLDTVGGALAVIGLGGATYGLIEGPAHGWSPAALAAPVCGIAALVAFVVYEYRRPDPMLPLRLFRSRNFTGANLATFGMYGALGGALFSVILYLQTAVGYAPLAAGLSFLPVTVVMLFFSSRMGVLSAKYGSRLFMTAGPILASIGFLLMLRISPERSNYLIDILPGVLVFACGLSVTVAPLTSTVMASVEASRSGVASAVNNAVSRIAGLFVVALLGVLVAAQTTQALSQTQSPLPAPAVAAVQESVAGGIKNSSIHTLPDDQKTDALNVVRKVQRGSFASSMLLNATLAFLAGLIAFLTIRNPRPEAE